MEAVKITYNQNKEAYVAEFNTSGVLLRANKCFFDLYSTGSDLVGMHISDIIDHSEINEESLKWTNLLQGKRQESIVVMNVDEKEYRINEEYVPIIENGRVVKIIAYGQQFVRQINNQ